MKLLLLEIDNVLYDSNLLKGIAREWAVTAMKEAGLPVDFDTAMETLMEVVRERGEDYPFHFNEMMVKLGLKEDYRVIAAGVIAYHDVKRAFLKPIPGIIDAILAARESGFRIGVFSRGDPVKEWEKILRLNIHHLIHESWVGRDYTLENVFSGDFDPYKTIYVLNSEESLSEAIKARVRFIVRMTDNGAEVLEDGRTEEVYELWKVGAAVRSLLGRL
ncbi:MAG: hypothetical protein QI197_04400 [Candidatus Korarchaeota archaeon]|nr:hypothetical protein [Candidatus Korarchaeota archaeon]